MGEYADYMLEGDDCYECGEHIGSGDGCPRLCSGCRKEEPVKKHMGDNKPFIMQNNDGAKFALKMWLKNKRFNSYTLGGVNKHNQPLIGLTWQDRPDSDWSKFDRAGLIICKDTKARDEAITIIDNIRKSKTS